MTLDYTAAYTEDDHEVIVQQMGQLARAACSCGWQSMTVYGIARAESHATDHALSHSDLRSHEPPRNSGEADAVNGPTALGEKPEIDRPA